jgi:hypothetical protein
MYHYVFVLFFSLGLRYILLNPLNDIQIHRLSAVYPSPWTLEPTINPLPTIDPLNADRDRSDSGAGSGDADGREGVFVVSPPPPNHDHADETPNRPNRKKMEPRKPIAVKAKLLLDVVSVLPYLVEAIEFIAEDSDIGQKVRTYLNTIATAGKKAHLGIIDGIKKISKISQIVPAHLSLTVEQRADERRIAAVSRKRKPAAISHLLHCRFRGDRTATLAAAFGPRDPMLV